MFTTVSGAKIGPIGQGTWFLGEHPARFEQEKAALQAGIEAGMTMIDTAEMYGEGKAEKLVGSAIEGYDREKLFLVSKVYPSTPGGKISSAAVSAPWSAWAPTIWTCTCSTGGAPSPWLRRWSAWRS